MCQNNLSKIPYGIILFKHTFHSSRDVQEEDAKKTRKMRNWMHKKKKKKQLKKFTSKN